MIQKSRVCPRCQTTSDKIICPACAYFFYRINESGELVDKQTGKTWLELQRGENEKPSPSSWKMPVLVVSIFMIALFGGFIYGFIRESISQTPSVSQMEPTPVPIQDLPNTPTPTLKPTATPTSEPTSTPTPTPPPTPMPTTTPTPTPVPVAETIVVIHGIEAPVTDFVFPHSSTTKLKNSDLKQWRSLSDRDKHFTSQLAINEIFARYGYSFKKSTKTAEDARQHFEDLEWYKEAQKYCPSSDPDVIEKTYMTSQEVYNIKLINAWQKKYDHYKE